MTQSLLVGERIYLRLLQDSDVTEEYLGWLNDSEVTRGLEAGKFPANFAEMQRRLEIFQNTNRYLAFAIIDTATNQHIGNITLYDVNWLLHSAFEGNSNWDHCTVVPGIMIGRKDFWGRGFATEAQSLIIDYAFQHLGVHKVVHGPIANNLGSVKMSEKLGFVVEGVSRQEVFIDGKFRDEIMMGLFAHEFRKSTLK